MSVERTIIREFGSGKREEMGEPAPETEEPSALRDEDRVSTRPLRSDHVSPAEVGRRINRPPKHGHLPRNVKKHDACFVRHKDGYTNSLCNKARPLPTQTGIRFARDGLPLKTIAALQKGMQRPHASKPIPNEQYFLSLIRH
jgi:hypothetical protein